MCALVRESSSWCCNNHRDSGDDLGHPQTQVTEVSLVYNGAVSTQGLRVCHGRRKLGSHTPAHKCFHPRSDPHHFCSSFISEIKPMATFNFQGIKVFLLRARARGVRKYWWTLAMSTCRTCWFWLLSMHTYWSDYLSWTKWMLSPGNPMHWMLQLDNPKQYLFTLQHQWISWAWRSRSLQGLCSWVEPCKNRKKDAFIPAVSPC